MARPEKQAMPALCYMPAALNSFTRLRKIQLKLPLILNTPFPGMILWIWQDNLLQDFGLDPIVLFRR